MWRGLSPVKECQFPVPPTITFQELVRIMDRLRDPGGCPWDREQTFATLRGYLLEECYEVVDALDGQNLPGLREELGLCLWMTVFLLLFEVRMVTWRRVVAAGLTGGVLLLLRNLEVVPLMVLMVWAMVSRRWSLGQAVVGVLLPIMIVMPFYVNQWRVHGDPFAMEKP